MKENERILGSTDIDGMGNPEFVADDSSISSTGLLSELVRYIDQVEADYKAIEREILSTDDMPAEFAEWSAPANTMRWGDKLRARLKDLSDNSEIKRPEDA